MREELTFDSLAQNVITIHQTAGIHAKSAVNQLMTLRNWLIGYYIVEYEQRGEDRAAYGTALLKNLEERVSTKGLNTTLFKNSRRFYKLYPQVATIFRNKENVMVQQLLTMGPMLSDLSEVDKKSPTVSDKFELTAEMAVETSRYGEHFD